MDEEADEKGSKRRTSRACDGCRRRKIRCIASGEANSSEKAPCVNCAQSKLSCTYTQESKKRGPPKGYVDSLENRVATLERLLKSLAPGVDFAMLDDATAPPTVATLKPQPDNPAPDSLNGFVDSIGATRRHLDGKALSHFLTDHVQAGTETGDSPKQGSSPEKHFHYDENKFFGRSSGFAMVNNLSTFQSSDSKTSDTACYSTDGYRTQNSHVTRLLSAAWRADSFRYVEPDQDLQKDLIDSYFQNFNSLIPLLHYPSFQRSYSDESVRSTPQFLSLLFSVLAIGSRFSNDPRVFQHHSFFASPDPETAIPSCLLTDVPEMSAGFAFAWAALKLTSPILVGATLYDMQTSVLMSYYFCAASALTSGWSAMGFYVRRMIDSGAHRRRNQVYNSSLLTDDLRKRAFWALFVLDRALSAALGRPLSMQDEDVDLDFPLEVTDEELDRLNALNLPWPRERPSATPPDQPIPMHAFNASIQLAQITGRTLKQLYTLSKPQVDANDGKPPLEQKVVAELDSSLNAWLNRLPVHLKWNPQDLDSPYLTQRALVLSMYYNIQLLVHRDFLSPDRKGILGFPSHMIVINAARSLCHILWNLLQRDTVDRIFPYNVVYALTATMPLLSNVYATNKVPNITDSAFGDVQKCLEVMKALTRRCFTAYHTCEGLCRLADLDDLRRMRNLKRSAPEEESPSQSGSSVDHSPPPPTDESHNTTAPSKVPKASKTPDVSQLPRRPAKRPKSHTSTVAVTAPVPIPQALPGAQVTLGNPTISTIDLPFYTADLASDAFGSELGSTAYQPPQPIPDTTAMRPPYGTADVPPEPAYDFSPLLPDPFNQYDLSSQPQYYAERQPAAMLQRQPFAHIFDPEMFGTALNDFTSPQVFYR